MRDAGRAQAHGRVEVKRGGGIYGWCLSGTIGAGPRNATHSTRTRTHAHTGREALEYAVFGADAEDGHDAMFHVVAGAGVSQQHTLWHKELKVSTNLLHFSFHPWSLLGDWLMVPVEVPQNVFLKALSPPIRCQAPTLHEMPGRAPLTKAP